nr:unnamed protein product [Brassica rapa]
MHWKSWESLCKPKECGGLGFKDLEALNLALLGKQMWRMLTNKNSLLTRVFKSRYFKKSDPLSAPLGSRPSYAWRSIHAAQKLVQQGARVIIGSGKDTKVWSERWIGSKPAMMVTSMRRHERGRQLDVSEDMRVSELLCGNGSEWNAELVRDMFTEEVKSKILAIRPAGRNSMDTYSWEYTKTGHYTVKSAYWVQTNIIEGVEEKQAMIQPSLDVIYQQVWNLETSPKIKHFLWRCLNNALPVAENMVHRHIGKNKECCRCDGVAESVNHLLFQCNFARLVWAEANVHIPPAGKWSDSLFSNLHWILNLKKSIQWRLWKKV